MTTGFNYETMEWKSYEDFFNSFLSETQTLGCPPEKGLDILSTLHLMSNTLTVQECGFVKKMLFLNKHIGTEIDSDCNRFGCFGTIRTKADEDSSCNCHSVAPCAKCTAGAYCPECDWDSDEDN